MSHNISLSTSSVKPLQAEAAFIAAKQAGYGGVELMVSPSRDTQSVSHILNLIDEYELPVTSVHAPTLLLCKFVWGTDPAGKLTRSVDFAEKIGATTVVVHPPFKTSSYATQLLPLVNKLNTEHDIDVAVENMFPWTFKGKTMEMYGPSWEETCETVEHLTFDFSHAALSGMNVLEFFNTYHHKVRLIHLTDGTTRARTKGDPIKDEHLLPGEGDMPIKEVYDILNKHNWVGDTVLEINTRSHKTLTDKLPTYRKALRYFNEVANPAL